MHYCFCTAEWQRNTIFDWLAKKGQSDKCHRWRYCFCVSCYPGKETPQGSIFKGHFHQGIYSTWLNSVMEGIHRELYSLFCPLPLLTTPQLSPHLALYKTFGTTAFCTSNTFAINCTVSGIRKEYKVLYLEQSFWEIIRTKIWSSCTFSVCGPIWMFDPILESSDPRDQNPASFDLTSEVEGGLHNLIKKFCTHKHKKLIRL